MDHEERKQAITAWIRKYRWAAAVLLAGFLLMLLPEQTPDPVSQPETAVEASGLQEQLEGILSGLQGAGRVQVLLTAARGEQVHYQTDADKGDTDERVDTVLITASDRSETGLVRRIDPPVWQGAVVLCQGADSPVVRLAVVEAVATATGLTSDRISVLKMK